MLFVVILPNQIHFSLIWLSGRHQGEAIVEARSDVRTTFRIDALCQGLRRLEESRVIESGQRLEGRIRRAASRNRCFSGRSIENKEAWIAHRPPDKHVKSTPKLVIAFALNPVIVRSCHREAPKP